MSVKPGPWYRTGDCRIVPWWFGIMRAEFMERRDYPDPYGGDAAGNGSYQVRWVGAGRFPVEFDNDGPFGFWSTMACSAGDSKKYGARALWRGFITYFKGNKDKP